MSEANPFLDDEDEETQAGSESTNFKQLRDFAKKLERQVNTQNKELEALRTFKAEAVVAQRKSVLVQTGLSEKHAALFLSLNKDAEVTPEAVSAFVAEYELPINKTEASAPEDVPAPKNEFADGTIQEIKQPEKTTPQNVGFAPVAGSATAAASVITDITEAQKLSVDNPAEYARLREAGRIKLSRLPGS